MRLFHVSPVYNRNSIIKYGLMPSPVKLDHHKETFKYYDLLDYEGKCLYTWVDSLNNKKFINDMIYCIVWLDPRNKIAKYFYENKYDLDMRRFYKKHLYFYSQMEFDVWSFDYQDTSYDFTHEQWPSDDYDFSSYGMDEKYAHKNKQLKILKETIYNPQLTGKGLYKQGKNGDITIKTVR